MVSLKQSLDDYDHVKSKASGLGDTLLTTLQSVRQYMVETDPIGVEAFRSWADAVIGKVESCLKVPKPAAFDELRTTIRAGLREYRDRAARYIDELRKTAAATTAALEQMLATLQCGDSDGEAQIKNEINRLESLRSLNDLNEMRAALEERVSSLAACVERLKREKDLVVAQLRDEIRILHTAIEQPRAAAAKDALTGALIRQEFQKALARELNAGRAIIVFRLDLQGLRNFPKRIITDQLVTAVYRRALQMLPSENIVGRWREDVFCILAHSGVVHENLAADLERKCGGWYVCMEGSNARKLYLEVMTDRFTFAPQTDAEFAFRALDGSGVTV